MNVKAQQQTGKTQCTSDYELAFKKNRESPAGDDWTLRPYQHLCQYMLRDVAVERKRHQPIIVVEVSTKRTSEPLP